MSVKDLKLARQKLSANNIECGLPGREDHSEQIYNFIFERLKIRKTADTKRAKVEAGQVANIVGRHMNKTMFICGVPGTGKTATVMMVLEKLTKLLQTKSSPIQPFQHVYVNGQQLATPEKVYSEILYQLTGQNCNPEDAQDKLDKIFMNSNESSCFEEKKRKRKSDLNIKKVSPGYKIVVVDELDLLYSDKRQSIFYSLFDWPTHAESKIILIGIANAMDLPERFIRSGRSRLGLEKRVFESYTGAGLETILGVRLGPELLKKCFQANAVTVATRRIGKMTGDARRILDTCRLAIDKAIRVSEEKGKFQQVTASIIDEVGFQNYDIQRRNYIVNCRPFNLFVLKCILIETARVGEENVEAMGVYNQLINLIKKHEPFSKYTLGLGEFGSILNDLAGAGIIYLESNKNLLLRRMFLQDDGEVLKDLIKSEQFKV